MTDPRRRRLNPDGATPGQPVPPAPDLSRSQPNPLPADVLAAARRAFGPANPNDSRWHWRVSLYYRDDVPPPTIGGSLALQTVHTDTLSRDTELTASRTRDDIARILVEQRIDDGMRGIPVRNDHWRSHMAWHRDDDGGWCHT